MAAPILAIGFRLLQGFALGGEIGPTTAFLLESVPVERRGFFGAFQSWTQNVSTLASGLVGFGLASVLSPRHLQDYGWRVAFLIGAAIVPFGLLLRRSLPETLYQHRTVTRERTSLRPYLSVVILGLLIMAGGTIGVYIIRTYMTTYAITTLHMAASSAFAATVVAGTCGVVFVLLAGSLSDRIGRKPVMLLPSALMLVLIFPGFSLLAHYRTVSVLLVVTAVLSSLAAISICPYTTWLAESLPPALRSGAVAVIYAIAVSVFGGTTQYAVTWLIRATGNPLAPAWYWIIAAFVGTVAMCLMRETAPFKGVETDRVRRVLVED